MQLWAAPPKGVPRPFLDSARWQHETGPWGTQPPHHQTGNADTEPGAPLSRPPQHARPADAINHAHLTNDTTYQLLGGESSADPVALPGEYSDVCASQSSSDQPGSGLAVAICQENASGEEAVRSIAGSTVV